MALRTFSLEGEMAQLPILNMLLNLMTFTLIPLVLGMLIRYFYSEFSEKAVEPIRKVVLYVMLLVLLLGIVSSYDVLLENYKTVAILVVTMNLLTMALGFGAAKLFKLPLTQIITITFEVGVQNLALSFAITFNILQRPDLAVAGLVYAVVMPATALGFVSIARRLLTKEENASG
jgi:BASS family bile acid:Na+ symporter